MVKVGFFDKVTDRKQETGDIKRRLLTEDVLRT
jgi:hypothetical protein